MKTTITEAEYLAELERTMVARPPAGAFTTEMLVARGLTRTRAYRALLADEAAGKLSSGQFIHKGKLVRFFWLKRKGRKCA